MRRDRRPSRADEVCALEPDLRNRPYIRRAGCGKRLPPVQTGCRATCDSHAVKKSVFLSPFDYRQNCLLYLPRCPPRKHDRTLANYYNSLADATADLIQEAYDPYADTVHFLRRIVGYGRTTPEQGLSAVHATAQRSTYCGTVSGNAGERPASGWRSLGRF